MSNATTLPSVPSSPAPRTTHLEMTREAFIMDAANLEKGVQVSAAARRPQGLEVVLLEGRVLPAAAR